MLRQGRQYYSDGLPLPDHAEARDREWRVGVIQGIRDALCEEPTPSISTSLLQEEPTVIASDNLPAPTEPTEHPPGDENFFLRLFRTFWPTS